MNAEPESEGIEIEDLVNPESILETRDRDTLARVHKRLKERGYDEIMDSDRIRTEEIWAQVAHQVVGHEKLT